MKYLEHVQQGMDLLAKDTRTIFVGQAMKYKGHAVSRQVCGYSPDKLLEFPVAEEMQAGFSIGLALEGKIPVCIYPRCNFAILACNQIINHIDKWEILTGQRLKIIIKMCVGSKIPLDPDFQHKANFSDGFKSMCEFIKVYELKTTEEVDYAYNQAFYGNESVILVEHSELY